MGKIEKDGGATMFLVIEKPEEITLWSFRCLSSCN